MFKKLLLSLVIILFACTTYAQRIVSTTPQNQNVVLEEFTGFRCGWCPEGHVISKSIQDNNPDRVSLISIHSGSFATPQPGTDEPDFRTPYGGSIILQSIVGSSIGFPAATINRHLFPGRSAKNGTAMYRENWTISADETLAIGSVVNVAVEASIEIYTNVLTVHVEGFYTSDSPESTNLLNVALLQNNTKGPQDGGDSGWEYLHMHRLVEMITGQWGEIVSTTTANTFIDRTYTYTIPLDYRDVLTEIADMEVVAFITNTHQEIPSGNRAFPAFTGLQYANDASIRFIENIPISCLNTISPKVNIQNLGQNTISSLNIEYFVNGESHTYNWAGNILSLKSETIELPEVSYNAQSLNTLSINIPEDDNNTNNHASISFDIPPTGSGTVTMELQVENNGNDIRWFIYDINDVPIYYGGSYPNNNPQTIYETFTLPENCYKFRIWNRTGEGGGETTLTDHLGTQLYYTDGDYGSGETIPFFSNGVLGNNENKFINIQIYPNPANSTINLKNAENANIQVYDLLGKMIFSMYNISMDEQIDVTKLQTGTYFMKISKDNYVTTKRFLVSK